MPQIVLHQWEMSPFCNKVRRCLRHKGLEFETVNYNGLKARRVAKLAPAGTLPVMDFDGERVCDSKHIVRFLDQKLPKRPLIPSEPQARAAAILWDDWAAQSLYFYEVRFRMLDVDARRKALDLICEGRPTFERALVGRYFRAHFPKKLREQGIGRLTAEEAESNFFELMEVIDQLLDGRPWLAGTERSVADHAVAAQLDEVMRTSVLGDRIMSHPRIKSWFERCGDGSW